MYFFRNKREVDIEPSLEEFVGNKYRETSTPKSSFISDYILFTANSIVKGNIYFN